jgi:butyryl-CoA dehydrogenase
MAGYAQALRDALDQLVNATHTAWDGCNKASEVLGNATAYLQAFGHVVMAWLMLDLSIVANERLCKEERRASLFQGLLHATRYFFRFELPKCAVWLRGIEVRDTTFLELEDEWL